jgi:hypothetical protein
MEYAVHIFSEFLRDRFVARSSNVENGAPKNATTSFTCGAVVSAAAFLRSFEEKRMKLMRYFALLAFVATLTLGAFAKDQNQGKFTLTDTVQLGSTQLKPGDYKAAWEGTGSDVQVKILKGKEVVATVPAKLADQKSGQDSVSLGNNNGTKTLVGIDFGGLHKGLVFDSTVTAQK